MVVVESAQFSCATHHRGGIFGSGMAWCHTLVGFIIWAAGHQVTSKLVQIAESTEEHMKRHSTEELQTSCPRCQYIRRQASLERVCSWVEPMSGNKYSWLEEKPGAHEGKVTWGLGCTICVRAKTGTIWSRFEYVNTRKLAGHKAQGQHQSELTQYLERAESNRSSEKDSAKD